MKPPGVEKTWTSIGRFVRPAPLPVKTAPFAAVIAAEVTVRYAVPPTWTIALVAAALIVREPDPFWIVPLTVCVSASLASCDFPAAVNTRDRAVAIGGCNVSLAVLPEPDAKLQAGTVSVGEVVIEGADRTEHSMIRGLVVLRPGERFRPSLVRRTQDRLMELGIFSSVTVGPDEPDLPARVKPVLISVSERRSQMLDFRAGVSMAQGIRGGFEYGYRNLFGKGIGLTLRVQLANQFLFFDNVLAERIRALSLADRLERRITLGVQLPYLPRMPNTRVSLSVSHLRDNQRAFGLDSNNVDLTFTVRPVRQLILTLSGGLENNDVDLLTDEDTYQELLMNAPPGLRVWCGATVETADIEALGPWLDWAYAQTRAG